MPKAGDAGDETLVPNVARHYAPRAQRSVPQLQWTDGAGKHAIALTAAVTAGSASKAELVIADPTVSRIHAQLEPRADGVWVRDLGSRNGTFVEGVRVEIAQVPEGGKFRLGETEMVLARNQEPAIVELWPSDRFGPLLGASAAMRELFAHLSRIAVTEAAVLVQGETGTGKELVARALHEASPRAKEPLVIIDCAALTESLLESELFGHGKGAFTGAVATRVGALESAHGGTVFLDEIGELPLSMQPRLLRALESKTVRRVGETAHRAIDVRFVSATHRDLRTMVNAGAFREDLYFRLAVLPVTLPALRERRDDIPMLVSHFLGGERLEADVSRDLSARSWLGNVRELRNFVERARALGMRQALELQDGQSGESLPPPAATAAATAAAAATSASVASVASEDALTRPFKEAREAWNDEFERAYVRKLLERHSGNVAEAAQAAGVDRTYVYRLIRKHRV